MGTPHYDTISAVCALSRYECTNPNSVFPPHFNEDLQKYYYKLRDAPDA